MKRSAISRPTVEAYRRAVYRVRAPSPWALRVGLTSPELIAAQRERSVDCSAFVTACNPNGRIADAAVNRRLQRELMAQLARLNLAFLPGVGEDPQGDWPGEESVLIFGLDLAGATRLGRRFRQNAVLWSGADGVPQLVLLR